MTIKAGEGEHLSDLATAAIVVAIAHHDLLADAHCAAADTADADTTHVGVVVELGNLELQRPVGIGGRCRRVLENSFKQRGHIRLGAQMIGAGPPLQGRGIDHREVELRVGGTELVEQVEGLINDPAWARTRTVDLVDHDDSLEAQRQCLAGDEARLRHRAFDSIDQQQHAIDHRQHTLNLAAKVGVPGSVDNVDAVAAVFDGAVLGQNGDATLFFDGIAVHDPFAHLFVGGEGA